MAFKYRVKKFAPERGEFIIQYYRETSDTGYEVNIPLPIKPDKTGYYSGKELADFIKGYGPQDTSEMEHLARTLPKSHIEAMVYDPFEGMSSEEVKKIKDDQMLFQYEDLISDFLDDAVRTKSYEGLDSMPRYLNSENEIWKNEAIKALAWGEEVWNYWYSIWNDYQENGTPIPPWEELAEQFPKLVW